MHKLGHRGFASVWLCRDTHAQPVMRYVAVKVLMAEVSVEDQCSELRATPLNANLDNNDPKGNMVVVWSLSVCHWTS
jgi:hypothetical protein